MAAASGSGPSVAALNFNLAPSQEYLLQGSIHVNHVDKLLEKLQGLCDGCDGLEPGPEHFKDHEMRYESPIDCAKGQPLQLHVSRSLRHADELPRVRYVGRTERGDASQPTSVRTNINVGVTHSIDDFLYEAGFTKAFDYVARGYMFRKGRIKITVARILENLQSHGMAPGYRFVTDSFLVEMSVVEAPNAASTAGVELRRFADNFKPLVDMIKPE